MIPPVSLSQKHLDTIYSYTERIAKELHVCGLMNMQYAICDDKVYVLEANPRASRTVPLVSKICNIQMPKIATHIMMQEYTNETIDINQLQRKHINHHGVKEAVFPFNMFPEVDPVLGPEMRSTGEVLGISDSFGIAFYKAQEATQTVLPESGTVFISVNDKDKEEVVDVARGFAELGFEIVTTKGTHDFLKQNGIGSTEVKKLHEGRPNVLDALTNNKITIVINTPSGQLSQHDDSYIRKTAIKKKIPYFTTLAAASAAVEGIKAHNSASSFVVKSLQEYHNEIR